MGIVYPTFKGRALLLVTCVATQYCTMLSGNLTACIDTLTYILEDVAMIEQVRISIYLSVLLSHHIAYQDLCNPRDPLP